MASDTLSSGSDLQQLRPIAAGMKVDFVPNAGAAAEIYMIDASRRDR
jgi:hypothetical protein